MKAAIVGAGHIAKQHLGALQNIGGVQIAVCDRSAVVAESVADRFDIQSWYTDYELMLSEHKPDIVHVTTPPTSHVPLARQAINAGAHVLVEKPIAPEYEQWVQLRDEAKAADRWVIEDHNYQFNRPVKHVLGLIEAGDFGEIVHAEVAMCLDIIHESPFMDANAPHPALNVRGGAIADFLTHLCYLTWLWVGPHTTAHSIWTKNKPDSPLPCDEMRALIDAERGTAAMVFSSHSQPDVFWVRVYGTKMFAQINLFEGTVHVDQLRPGPRPLTPFFNGVVAAGSAFAGAMGGLKRKLSGSAGAYEGLWELVRLTYLALRSGGSPPVSIQQIDEVNRLVAELASQSPS